MRRFWWPVAAVVAGVGLLAGAAVVVQAGNGDNGNPAFLDRVAEKLGIERSKLDQAIADARKDEIDEKVQSGDLTQEQADKLKERLDNGGAAPFGFGHRGPGPHGGGPGPGLDRDGGLGFLGPAFGIGKIDDDFAAFLGISTDQLRDELSADGATLASVAGAHGKSRDDLKQYIRDQVQERLDGLLGKGTIDQARVDALMERLDGVIDMLIDRPFGGPFRFFHDQRQDDRQDEGDSTPAPQRFDLQERFRS
jgi:hypothetical protein